MREFVLALSREGLRGPRKIAIHKGFKSALADWDSSTRSSPIFSLGADGVPDLGKQTPTHLAFIGPIHPSRLPRSVPAYLTLGLYNVILVAASKVQQAALSRFLAAHGGTSWEKWIVRGGKIQGLPLFSAATEPNKKKGVRYSKVARLKVPARIQSTADEYRALVATTASKAREHAPALAEDAVQLDRILAREISKDPLPLLQKHQWLVLVNAALSRLSSQALAGTSPIAETECHYWTNSLLGIGVACLALVKLRRFTERTLGAAELHARLKSLSEAPPHPVPLYKVKSVDEFWRRQHLPPLHTSDGTVERIPLIVHFSGRDGFRSTVFGLSAPLEVLRGCNTVAWSLMTLTHELSHVFIDSLMGVLLEDLRIRHQRGTDPVLAVLQGEVQSCLLDQVKTLMVRTITELDKDSRGLKPSDPIDYSEEEIVTAIQRYYQEANEILTHIFDFMYFYRRDHDAYLAYIWSSWDVIPNIEDRIDDYLTRSLCAVHVNNLSVAKSADVTVDQVLAVLTKLSTNDTGSNYLGIAAGTLKQKRDAFKLRLHRRTGFVKIALAFLNSPDAARALTHDPESPDGSYSSFSAKKFSTNQRFQNPLRFIAKYSHDVDPDPAKSLWMLTQVALMPD